MTKAEIQKEISDNVKKLELFNTQLNSLISSRDEWYVQRDRSAYHAQQWSNRKELASNKQKEIADLKQRQEDLKSQLSIAEEQDLKEKKAKEERDLIESKAKAEAEKKLADKGLTPESVLAEQQAKAKAESDLAKAKADAETIKAKADSDIAKQKADYELAQRQKADNEMAIKLAKESQPKGMSPILKISLIALGVAGVMIGGFLLVKKK
jgi:multidrug efflux pump subunit AcrA (membrane-fusion protein)